MILTNLDALTPTQAELNQTMPTDHTPYFAPDAVSPKCLQPSIRHTSRQQRLDAVKRLIEQHPEQDRGQMARTICSELNVSMPTAYSYLREVVCHEPTSSPTTPNHP